ncbi:MAG: hypothetical protein LBS59_08700, partial [Puniceicoccales bacterium]|nr:hypothetical protein [Puniceicoccales bacterium]
RAVINGPQAGKLVSIATLQKSNANGFTDGQHNGGVANVAALFKHALRFDAYRGKTLDGRDDANVVIHRFAAPVRFKSQQAAGETSFAYLTVKETKQHGNRVYSLELVEMESLRDKGGVPVEAGRATRGAIDAKIDALLAKVNPESIRIAIDENGEPKVGGGQERYLAGLGEDGGAGGGGRGGVRMRAVSAEVFGRLIELLKKTGLARNVITDRDRMREYLERHLGADRGDRAVRRAGIRRMATSKGEVYGFVTPEGDVYLDLERMNANTPIHEFGHLFWNAGMPEKMKGRIIQLLRGTRGWRELEGNPAYSNLRTDEQKADELFNTLLGDYGEDSRRVREMIGGKDATLWEKVRGAIGEPANGRKQRRDWQGGRRRRRHGKGRSLCHNWDHPLGVYDVNDIQLPERCPGLAWSRPFKDCG